MLGIIWILYVVTPNLAAPIGDAPYASEQLCEADRTSMIDSGVVETRDDVRLECRPMMREAPAR